MNLQELVASVLRKEGLSKNDPDEEFDPKELAFGIKAEMEHTKDKEVAKEIAKDHLKEFPNYYKHLEKMENKLKEK